MRLAATLNLRSVAFALTCGMTIWLLTLPVIAAETASQELFPITPDPSECVVAPRPDDLLQPLFATPDGEPDIPAGSSAPSQAEVVVPVGQPVDAVVAAEIVGTLRKLHACYNAGDMRRVFAFVTDTYLHDLAARSTLTPEDYAYFFGEPRPAPESERTSLVAVTDMTMLVDGRVGAFVVSSNPIAGSNTDFMILSLHDDRWLIDEIIEFAGG